MAEYTIRSRMLVGDEEAEPVYYVDFPGQPTKEFRANAEEAGLDLPTRCASILDRAIRFGKSLSETHEAMRNAAAAEVALDGPVVTPVHTKPVLPASRPVPSRRPRTRLALVLGVGMLVGAPGALALQAMLSGPPSAGVAAAFEAQAAAQERARKEKAAREATEARQQREERSSKWWKDNMLGDRKWESDDGRFTAWFDRRSPRAKIMNNQTRALATGKYRISYAEGAKKLQIVDPASERVLIQGRVETLSTDFSAREFAWWVEDSSGKAQSMRVFRMTDYIN